jgi:C4-dicarboxylate transporter, DctM subunit
VTETSVGQLFVAGVVPALLLTAALMVAVAVIARRNAFPRQRPADWRELLVTARRAFWGLLLIVIVLGGIYGGVFTPTEAAAVAAVYAFVVAVFVHRDVQVVEVPRILTESARTTAMLMLIIGNAYLFAFVLTTEQIPQQAADWIVGMGLAPWAFLLALNLLLLLAGNFMEPTSVVLIVAPIVFPIAIELGIDPVHLGILMVLNMQIGLVTPPVGLNLFVTAGYPGSVPAR